MDSGTDPYEVRRAAPDAAEEPAPREEGVPPDAVSWRVRPGLVVVKAVGAVVFLAAGIWAAADPVGLAIGIGGAVVLAALAARDLVAGTTVRADRSGVTVRTGIAGHRHLDWYEIERIRVDRRARLGIRTELVELDCDDELYLFGANQLGAPCDQVVATLTAMRDRSEAAQ